MICPRCGFDFSKRRIVKVTMEDGLLTLKIWFGRPVESLQDEDVERLLNVLKVYGLSVR